MNWRPTALQADALPLSYLGFLFSLYITTNLKIQQILAGVVNIVDRVAQAAVDLPELFNIWLNQPVSAD